MPKYLFVKFIGREEIGGAKSFVALLYLVEFLGLFLYFFLIVVLALEIRVSNLLGLYVFPDWDVLLLIMLLSFYLFISSH